MKRIILVFCFVLISCSVSASLYREKHDDVLKVISPVIEGILVFHGLCKDANDCGKKQLFFLKSGKNALYVSLYSITDLKVIQDVVESIFIVYEKNNSTDSINFQAYKKSHSESKGIFKVFFNKNEPFFTMSIKEK